MTSDPLTLINLRRTLQTEQADPTQVQNSAGGYVFQADEMARLRRFLVMGTEGGTYYVGERELAADNARLVIELAQRRGTDVIAEILAISLAGRAPRQNPTIFALAAVAGIGGPDPVSTQVRRDALAILPQVCRTGTHLFLFAKYVEQFRGWGRALKRGVAAWYLDQSVEKLAYQLIKYRYRDGWTHRDLLRLSHPETDETDRRAAFDFACGRYPAGAPDHMPPAQPSLRLLEGFIKAQASPTPLATAILVAEYGLPWEALKPEHLSDAGVWGALLDRGMPQTALMRNLPRLTRLGLLFPGGSRADDVARRLSTGMSKAKVHPVNVLVAQRTYAGGRSIQGSSEWHPVSQITDALDAGFYEAFGGVEPAGKRTLFALDVSGSMAAQAGGLPIRCREAGAAIGMVTMATEPFVQAVGFTAKGGGYGWGRETALTPIDLSPRRRLDDVVRSIANLPFGGTDCALPMIWALENSVAIQTFVVVTDNETWAGNIHPHQALRRYREQTGIPARLVVLGMTSSGFTVNDPRDPLGLDVAGFDSAVPNLVSDFSAGRV